MASRRVGAAKHAAMMLALCAGLGVTLVACGDAPPPAPPAVPAAEWTAPRSEEAEALLASLAAPDDVSEGSGGLSVRLAFGAAADLDLYVTGPRAETVYYANTPSAIGGELVADRRCVHAAPRIEVVRFSSPLRPGRYRVGVDYPRACSDAKSPAPFALEVRAPDSRERTRGLARHRVFEAIVLEFEIEPQLEFESDVESDVEVESESDGGMHREGEATAEADVASDAAMREEGSR